MAIDNDVQPGYYNDEAPKGKDIVVVLFVILLLIVVSWFAYKLGLLN